VELSALAAVAYWGWSEPGGAWRWVLVIAAPAAVAILWGKTIAPKASRRVLDPWRLLVELVVFGTAVAALVDTDQPTLAVVLACAVAVHLALTFLLGQRSS
jgi:hypothetical protein